VWQRIYRKRQEVHEVRREQSYGYSGAVQPPVHLQFLRWLGHRVSLLSGAGDNHPHLEHVLSATGPQVALWLKIGCRRRSDGSWGSMARTA